MLACNDKHRVSATLATQRGACSAEGERQLILLAQLYDFRDFLLAVTTNDDLWNLAIETGIGSPSKGTKFIGINTV